MLVAALLFFVVYMTRVPTTFGCRAFIDASAEARLQYPNGRVLSYASREGNRELIPMSNPQEPGFTKYWKIPLGDQESFRWFDEQLQAMGWKPLELGDPQYGQNASTTRGSAVVDGFDRGAERISLSRFTGSRILEVGPFPEAISDDQAVMGLIYFITLDAVPACR